MPPDLPVLRIVDPLMAQRMAMWVLWGVINHQRKMDAYLEVRPLLVCTLSWVPLIL